MILAAADRDPTRTAIEEADGCAVSYADLVARARRFAAGYCAATIVEVAAVRSADFVARCLGAWLVGAAWLPIDAADPRRPAMAGNEPGMLATLDDKLAYVIATSGSSGVPKLVAVGHRGLPALLRTQIDAFALGPGARSLWLHAPVFDASLSDWGTALASGGTLVVPAPETLASPTRLREELVARAITHVDLPPSLLPYVVDPPHELRVVVLGGEPCPVELVRALAARLRVVVVYGPTEATVCSSLIVVDPARWNRPLIGNPLPGVTYRVIDGELWIGGDALAFGYLGDPEETARRFPVHDGSRLYRTGDRVEPCDGGLAFVGRVDRQAKIAGRRVELAEIEAALRRMPDVRDAAVVLRTIKQGDSGRAHLVGFIEPIVANPIDDASGLEAALRSALRELVPAWMIPTRIVIGALPRTVTGKLDRRALEHVALGVHRQAPAGDDLEAELAMLWCDVLGTADVSPADRFIEHGGDSLARLAFHTAAAARSIALADTALAGDPSFGELVAHVRAPDTGSPLTVAACEARGRAARAGDGVKLVNLSGGRAGDGVNLVNLSGVDTSGRSADRDEQCRKVVKVDTVPPATLITGASGLLGRALVARWPGPVIAFVRAVDDAAARQRLGDIVRAGVEVICGDVALPRLGLGERGYAALGARVGAVVHAAATIALADDWDAHAATNVNGTAHVVRFAAEHGIALHHVSTLSVFVATDRGTGRHAEHAVPEPDAIAYGGYAQTKLAAEAIARDLRGRRAPTTVFRLGLLVPESARKTDQLAMTVRGLMRLGAVPAGASELRFDVTPAGHAAAAIVALVARAEQRAADDVHHVAAAEGTRFGALVGALRAAGATLPEVPVADWLDRARGRLADPDIAMAWASLVRLHGRASRALDLFLATDADFAVERTRDLLATLGVTIPVLDRAWLDRLARGLLATIDEAQA